MDSLDSTYSVLHPLAAPEDVGALRRSARALAFAQKASEAECARVELVATELGSNTLHHARPPGYVLLQPLHPSHARGLELIAVDEGPGIANLAAALDDSNRRFELGRDTSSGGALGLGCGLASVRRLASEFDIYSAVGRGTVVLARMVFERVGPIGEFRWGAVSVPVAGEVENGDGWSVTARGAQCSVLVADGLGHGPAAAVASNAALALFQQRPALDIASYLEEAHAALRSTRGAAVTVCQIFAGERRMLFSGVGNVEGRVFAATRSEGLTPRSGTLGMHMQAPKFHVRELPWEAGSTLVLHSDGVRHCFDFDDRAALEQRDPSLLAAVIHRDFKRVRDDATVVVVRHAPTEVK